MSQAINVDKVQSVSLLKQEKGPPSISLNLRRKHGRYDYYQVVLNNHDARVVHKLLGLVLDNKRGGPKALSPEDLP